MNRTSILLVVAAVSIAIGAVVTFTMPSASAKTESPATQLNETSAWVKVEGGEKRSISKGEIITHAARLSDGTCDTPRFTVGMNGDVKSIDTVFDENCTLSVKDIVLNPKVAELEALIEQTSGKVARAKPLMTGGWKWEVRSYGEWQGTQPVNEELTQAIASVKFKTALLTGGGSVYDGDNPWHDCWANWSPPVFYWIEDACTHLSFGLSGPNQIWSSTKGKYHHSAFGWNHDIIPTAAGIGWVSTPSTFSATCIYVGTVPPPSHAHCELWWNLIGWVP
jgi:hypothetical protein